MATVQVPNFASIVRAQPKTVGLPTGTVIAGTVANTLGTLASNMLEKRQEKDAIMGFANIMAETDPQQAKMYAQMANSIPLFDASILAPGGGGGRSSGGGSDAVGGIMKTMLNSINQERELKNAIALDDHRTKNDAALTKIKYAQDLSELAERQKGLGVLEAIKQQGREVLAQKKEAIEAEKDTNAKNRLILDFNKLNLEQQKLEEGTSYRQEQLELQTQKLGVEAAKAVLTDDRLRSKPPATQAVRTQIDSRISQNSEYKQKRDEILRKKADPLADPGDRASADAEMEQLRARAYDDIAGELPQLTEEGVLTPTPLLPPPTIGNLLKGVIP